ncbi:hypothetical protein L593_07290 [Salinarchaeum sp. Harcht-Bsk1]|uniref:hypothetical protein n=1 Tax=Salinarchaeum sp. Harcht-Bsk1 TaxID=1333523 RepID=UPI0003423D0E|nr:hypothetical protein [Salinarchaeum sp. Harcht-Bsk1]AGN01405.1 hypothetical protein L593_07290 [Salinarchaeum sp. Harcht-Bsk1]
MSLQTVFDRHRFGLYYGSLVLVGLSILAGQFPALLAASSPSDVSPLAAVLAVGGLVLATTSAWEALHSDRAEWEADQDEGRILVAVTIGFGALVAGVFVYVLLTGV